MTRTGLLLSLVTLGLGCLLGYLAGASGGGAHDSPVGGSASPDSSLSRDVSRSMPELGRAASADDPRDRDPLPAGAGRITGRVSFAGGEPVAGVVVRATPLGSRERKGHGPREPDLESEVRRYEARLRFERESRREATTDETGRYELTGIADTEHRLEAFLEGHEIRVRGRNGATAGPGDTVSFLAVPITDVRLSVLLPDGSQADRATLTYVRVAASSVYVPKETARWSRRDSSLQLEPGSWRLTATGGRHDEFRSDEVTVGIAVGVAPEPVTLRLAERPGIRGQLHFPSGHPGLEARVSVLRIGAGEEVADDRVLADGEEDWIRADSETGYAFVDVEPGTWVVLVSVGLSRVVGRAVLDVADRTVTKDFEVPPPEPGDFLMLRVEAPDGTALRDVTIQTGYVAPHSSSMGGGQATLLPDGTYRVQHHDVMSMRHEEEGRYVVIASSPEYGEIRREYDADETPSLTVRFGDPVALEVRLVGFAGSPYEKSLRLSLAPVAGAFSTESVTPDAEGRHEFGPVAPGEYELLVGVNAGPGPRWVMKRSLTLKGGARLETVVIPPLFDLTVIAGDLGDDAKIGLRFVGGDVSIWIAGKAPVDGRIRFDRLPAGRYVVFSVDGDAPGKMVVALGGSATVRFAAQTMDALYVSIRDASGHLARAGLREGDLVVAIDGEEVLNEDQGRGLLATARPKDTAMLTVRRGRARLEIAVNPAKITGAEAGGRLLPSPR